MSDKGERLQVIDTTALSNFAHIQRPDLLRLALKGEGTITALVMAEILAGESLGVVPAIDWNWLRIIKLTSEEERLFQTLALTLDDGEASCLAVAMIRRTTLITDDLPARRLAIRASVTLSGTVGILRLLVAEGHLSIAEGDKKLSEMIRYGYHSPVRSLLEIRD
jgi:predicted nucleic acid-binding protein